MGKTSKYGSGPLWFFEVVEYCMRLTENLGLPLHLLEKHGPWPAYVTYTSPVVQKFIEKSKARELECIHAFEESQRTLKSTKSSSIFQLKRKQSLKSTDELALQDALSETVLSMWGTYSVSTMGPITVPEPMHLQTESRDNPTAKYNKIIFSRKPMLRMIPYNSVQVGKEKHMTV
uniref:CMT1A duplicated region transcript 4 protein n=1 Tax=Castor canadensis TaxID=51338 RepID=A0A8B7WDF5_CASCN|nr:CMT1A duplicated region transcript 4 protein [Castor canadensis]